MSGAAARTGMEREKPLKRVEQKGKEGSDIKIMVTLLVDTDKQKFKGTKQCIIRASVGY